MCIQTLHSSYVLVSFAGWSPTVRHVLAVPAVVSIRVHTGIQRSFPGHLLFFVRELLQHWKWLFWRWRGGRWRWKWRGEWGDAVIPSSAHSELPRPVDQRLFPHPHLNEACALLVIDLISHDPHRCKPWQTWPHCLKDSIGIKMIKAFVLVGY